MNMKRRIHGAKTVLVLGVLSLLGNSVWAQLTPGQLRQQLESEVMRTDPNFIVHIPQGPARPPKKGVANEHFLVFDGPDGSLMTVWTQSHGRRKGNYNHIVFSRSEDEGKTWAAPTHIAGPTSLEDPAHIACWGFPMVSKSGRIYIVWNQNQGVAGWILFHTGTMAGCYSDDNGETWSPAQDIPMPPCPYDDPDDKIPSEWIVWQLPQRDLQGRYYAGYTHWINEKVARYGKEERSESNWDIIESVVEFMRFDNLDDNPEPKDLKVRFFSYGEDALRVPHYMDPLLSVAQEPSIVRLPDQRLFCTMRSNSGYIWYALSEDDGETWCNPRPLLRKDKGLPIQQPVGSCPIYQLADGRYILLHHNNPGDRKARQTSGPRRPAFIALGAYQAKADQPIWFCDSKELMDNDELWVDGTSPFPYGNVAVYTSFTTRDKVNVLWYPDRKYFLLGKIITDEFLADLNVPQ